MSFIDQHPHLMKLLRESPYYSPAQARFRALGFDPQLETPERRCAAFASLLQVLEGPQGEEEVWKDEAILSR